MFKKTNKNPRKSSESRTKPITPDPWETTEPETHFPSPLELDRLLREEHPLIGAAPPHAAISSAEIPTGLLAPPHGDRPVINPAKVLLQNELKLQSNFAEKLRTQIGKALALLYWMPPEQPAI